MAENNYNPQITQKKGFVGALYGLVAVVIAAIAQALTGYTFGDSVPTWVNQLWVVVIPSVVGGLKALSNWLKNKGTA